MPLSRSAYNVVESFTADNGFEYAKVVYKGIEQTGYISRIAGPGNTITEGWYKEKKREEEPEEPPEPPGPNTEIIVTVNGETRTTKGFGGGDTVKVEAEISGVFSPGEAPELGTVKDRATTLAREIGRQMAFIDKDKVNVQRRTTMKEATNEFNVDEDLSIEFDRSSESYQYELDPDQMRISDSRW